MLKFGRYSLPCMLTFFISSLLKRLVPFILSAAGLLVGLGDAHAWGFGRAQPSAVLGQPLDFSVELRLDPSEPAPECLSAEVSSGDIPVPRSVVYVSLEASPGGTAVRVRTSVVIDEPVVTVTLSAGCASSVSRRFTLFADPPGHLAALALPQAESLQAIIPVTSAVAMPAPPSAADRPGSAAVPAAPSAPPVSRAPRAGRAAQGAPPRGSRPAAPSASGDRLAVQQGATRAARSKLQLDAPTVLARSTGSVRGAELADALASAQEAASAARASASAAQARAADMQKSIEALRQEAQANREAVARLTQALADSQGGVPHWLLAVVAALGGLCVLLFVRIRRLQTPGGPAPWWTGGAAALVPGSGGDAVKAAADRAKEAALPRASEGLPERAASPTPQPAFAPISGLGAAQVNPPGAQTGTEAAELPSVSIDELLDLQQRVEFFLVLGQEDAALKLLVEHLRVTLGDCPLPHLHLMDMYRHRGDPLAFNGARGRFQQQFGVAWPDWNQGPQASRQLEDVPDLLSDIQRVWHDPVQAMKLLEAMLRATDRIHLLDQALQSDLLFLFALARDLHDRYGPASPPLAGAVRPDPAVATLATAVALKPAQPPGAVEVDIALDMPVGEDTRLDLLLPMGTVRPVAAAGPAALPRVEGAAQSMQPAQPLRASPVIDLRLEEGAEGRLADGSAGAAASTAGRNLVSQSARDRILDKQWSAGGAHEKPVPVQAGTVLSPESPGLDPSGWQRPPAAASVAGVDLELSFDEPELPELPDPLSAGEERAAGRFNLFSDEAAPVKRR